MTGDFDDLNRLVADLAAAPTRLIPKVIEIVESNAEKVAGDWKEEAADLSGKHAKKYSKTIFSKLDLNKDGEIGASVRPRRGHQGNLGEVLELGGGGIKSAPQHAGRKALRKHEADFLRDIGKAGEDAFG